ncbi:transmembrane protein 200C [Platichthys flesus]|uniref:transmembrane protein 200C n=1 Tax=Platichthys flesus TaxID=8260 RepID=UPI002DB69C4B|nr:transmembrane protein 200C [Platichthys flesus]XP_062236078.1 transmembrane protein 200C [Platichthys flesus]XP_062236079.1 transmembrane protein 200C [Platichthys flesus]
MIATGGLLRINARRQDSNKTHKPHTHKKKSKKRRKSEVVVVKGKLKLCSLSGLVAALGVLVLLGGVVMATLGYWPRDGLLFRAQPQEGAAMASVSSISSTPAPTQGEERGEGLQREEGGGGADDTLNQTESINRTRPHLPRSFVGDFLDRYLYSDRLKVFGPLIMGIGIFLFICANAVLHEVRDKKTKVINLRDIYSTVIDLHSLRRPHPSSSTNPLNGLINYVQSKSLDSKPSSYPAPLTSRREGGVGGGGAGALSRQQLLGSTGGGGADRGGGGADRGGGSVFSIYQNTPPLDDSSHILPLPTSISPLPPPLQRGGLSFFTLPLRRPPPTTPRRRHSARARTGGGVDKSLPRPLSCCTSPSPRPLQEGPLAASCSSSSLHMGAPGGSQALFLSFSSLTPSHLSLSSLSHLLSPSSHPMKDPPSRRQSLPTGSVTIAYRKLTHGEVASFESTEMTSLHPVTSQKSEEMTSQRKYSNREKLRMLTQLMSGDDQSGADITTLQS